MRLIGLLFASAAVCSAGAQAYREFISVASDLAFRYPNEWKFGARRTHSLFEAKLPSGGAATIEIFEISYRLPLDEFSKAQAQAAAVQKRTIEKQWVEEVLSVPVAMSQVSYTVGAEPMTALTALIYSRTPLKLQLRLTTATANFAEADQALRGAMQTLRTVSGDPLKADDPALPDLPPPPKNTKPIPPKVEVRQPEKVATFKPEWTPPTKGVFRGPVSIKAKAGGRDVALLLPSGFTVEQAGESFTVKHEKLSKSLVLHASSILDSPPPAEQIVISAASTLPRFSKVTVREEPLPKGVVSGGILRFVRREGQGADGQLAVVHALGEFGDFYWVANYEQSDAATLKKEWPFLLELLQRIRIEPAT